MLQMAGQSSLFLPSLSAAQPTTPGAKHFARQKDDKEVQES